MHILIVPENKERTGVTEVKWCFCCRAHLTHHLVMHTAKDIELHYWAEPYGTWECERCGHDRTEFGAGCW